MDFTKFQNKLNKAWEEILDKKEIDENYEKGAQVKAHNIYWFTLNKNNLPGVIIKENNHKINLSKFPKPKPVIPTPVGIATALAPIAYEQTKNQQQAGSDSMGKTIATRMKDTARDIQGTPAEIAADKKRTKAAKAKNVPKPKRKPKVPTSTEKSSNPEVYVDSSVTYDMDNMPKKMSGGKVNYRKSGGKIGRGCGAAQRGGGKVMK